MKTKKLSNAPWFGYGTAEAYYAATPFVTVIRSVERCKYTGRYTLMAMRHVSEEERAKADWASCSFVVAELHDPDNRWYEGLAEPAYPYYQLPEVAP